MRIFPIGCEVIFTRPDDPHKNKIGVITSAPSENGKYTVDVENKRILRHGDDMCEASQYMKEKAMQNNYLMLLHDNSVIIDTETTGLDGNAEICEISIIDANGNTLLDTFVKPSKAIPNEAIAIHGISNEMVADAPTFTELNDQIKSSLAGKDIIVYNAQYDMRILTQAAHHSGVDTQFYQEIAPKARCAMLAYSQWYNEPGNYNKPKWHKLTVACEQQQIDTSAITAHRANADCQMTLMLIKNCKYKHGAKMQTPDTQLSQVTDLNQLVRNTNAIIEIDVDGAIAYIDKRVADTPLDELEPELRKWYKDLGEKRLQLTRPVNESLKQVIADEKKIGDYINKIFAENQAKKDAAEAERKKAKHAEVMAIMADMLNDVDLPPEYLSKVVFREEYYQKTMVNKKLKDSIQEQIDTQVNLYNGWKAEQELRQQHIKNREMQIALLNQQYGANGTYSMFTIETHTDEQVVAKYEANHQRKEQARLEKERQNAEEVKKQAEANENLGHELQQATSPVSSVVKSAEPTQAAPSAKNVGYQNESEIATHDNTTDNQAVGEKEPSADVATHGISKTFTITINAGNHTKSVDAMNAVMDILDSMPEYHAVIARLNKAKENFSATYGIKMDICQA